MKSKPSPKARAGRWHELGACRRGGRRRCAGSVIMGFPALLLSEVIAPERWKAPIPTSALQQEKEGISRRGERPASCRELLRRVDCGSGRRSEGRKDYNWALSRSPFCWPPLLRKAARSPGQVVALEWGGVTLSPRRQQRRGMKGERGCAARAETGIVTLSRTHLTGRRAVRLCS